MLALLLTVSAAFQAPEVEKAVVPIAAIIANPDKYQGQTVIVFGSCFHFKPVGGRDHRLGFVEDNGVVAVAPLDLASSQLATTTLGRYVGKTSTVSLIIEAKCLGKPDKVVVFENARILMLSKDLKDALEVGQRVIVEVLADAIESPNKRPMPVADGNKPLVPVPDKETIAKFLTAYLKTPYADRGKYVTDTAEFEKVQERYYKGTPMADDLEVVVTSVKIGPKADYLTVVSRITGTVLGQKRDLGGSSYLLNTKQGLKFDWSANVGYNPVGFKAWAAGTETTYTVRAEAKLDDYYNYHYGRAKGTHYSVSLSDRLGEFSFHGYVTKDSALGKKLFEILKDGQEHRVTLTIERTGRETSVVGIMELVSETWVK